MNFSKWHGLGNDYILVLERDIPEQYKAADGGLTDSVVRAMCDRHFGIGGDGILVFGKSQQPGHDARMLIHNPDASQAEMCGNGIRMAARFLMIEGEVSSPSMTIETAGGTVRPTVLDDGRVTVDMGIAEDFGIEEVALEDRSSYRGRIVSMGNPHFVIRQEPQELDIAPIGSRIEVHERFPNRTNVEFAVADDSRRVRMRVWERGVGETLACGTGACAVGVTSILDYGCESPVTVTLPGGDLEITVGEDLRVFMSGPAVRVATGTVDIEGLLDAAPLNVTTTEVTA